VAEPWTRDLDALDERSRHGLRSLGSFAPQPKETKMRFFKTHPALAAIAVLATLSLAGGAAYAVVREVWISIDENKSAPEIAQDVTTQLQQQGIPATAKIDKRGDGSFMIQVTTPDDEAGSDLSNMHIRFGDKNAHMIDPMGGRSIKLDVRCELTDAQMKLVQDAAPAATVKLVEAAVAAKDFSGVTSGGLAKAIQDELVARGFHGASVVLDPDVVRLIIPSPPQP
jgi:hypothetical protein